MKIKYLLLASVIVFSSCNSTEKKIEDPKIVGSWQLSKVVNFDKENLDIDQEKRTTLSNAFLSKGKMLVFYPDSTYTSIEDATIKHGKWSYLNDNEIKYGTNTLKIEQFDKEGSMNRIVVIDHDEDKAIISELEFVEELEKLKEYKKDPLYVNNNKWRQKPLKKENDAEITSRLANYILHVAYILKAAYDRNDVKVSFNNSQGIIKIFQGGIGVVNENKINEAWKTSFYDEEDAMKAYSIYSNLLGKEGFVRSKSSGDWVKEDYEILLKLHSKLLK